jgi:hypothetical protein
VQVQSCPTHVVAKQQEEGFLPSFGLLILFGCDFELGLYVAKCLGRCKFHIGISILFVNNTQLERPLVFHSLGRCISSEGVPTWEEEEMCKIKLFFLSQLTHVCQKLKVLQVIGIFFVTIVYNKFTIEDGISMK